jgi:hypothetical protein
MDYIEALFERMDHWRHLPSYQLERRADLLFSLYLPEVLESKLSPREFQTRLIPEFPVKQSNSNRSDKVDYLAVTRDSHEAVFVELKTDGASLRDRQFEYLIEASKNGMEQLISNLNCIRKATRLKSKYNVLVEAMLEMGLQLDSPGPLPRISGVVLIQPGPDLDEAIVEKFRLENVALDVISFHEFRETVKKHDDPLSQRFAQSLEKWIEEKPGQPDW